MECYAFNKSNERITPSEVSVIPQDKSQMHSKALANQIISHTAQALQEISEIYFISD